MAIWMGITRWYHVNVALHRVTNCRHLPISIGRYTSTSLISHGIVAPQPTYTFGACGEHKPQALHVEHLAHAGSNLVEIRWEVQAGVL